MAVAVFAVLTPVVLSAPGPTVAIAWIVEHPGGTLTTERALVHPSALHGTLMSLRGRPDVAAAGTVAPVALLEGPTSLADQPAGLDPYFDRQWALHRLDAARLAELDATGQGVTVAVVDTGVDASHPELSDRVLSGYDVYATVTTPGDGRSDPNGHGTHVAGIIAAARDGVAGQGLAPGVRILPVRVLDASGYADDADVARGVVWAQRNGAQVINLSLGGNDVNSVLADAVKNALASGIAVVAAVGNSGPLTSPVVYPAAYPGVLGVAATSGDDQAAWFSTRGAWVDIGAPGLAITSTWPGGNWRIESGTSMATPYVSAAVAIVMATTGLSPLDAVDRLVKTASEIPYGSSRAAADGRDDATGVGLVDPLAALTGTTPRKLADRTRPPEGSLPPTINLTPLPLPELIAPTLPALPRREDPVPFPLPVTVVPTLPIRPDPNLPGSIATPDADRPTNSKPSTPTPSTPTPSTPKPSTPTTRPDTGTTRPTSSKVEVKVSRRADGSVVARLTRNGLPVVGASVKVTTAQGSRLLRSDTLGRVSVVASVARSPVRFTYQGRTYRL